MTLRSEIMEQPDILAHRDRALLLNRADERAVLPAVDGLHELASHASGRSGDSYLHLWHGFEPSGVHRASGYSTAARARKAARERCRSGTGFADAAVV